MLGGATDIHDKVLDVLEYERNPDKLAEIALSTLEKHVRAKLPTPKLIHTTICRDAIPQYPVGYRTFLSKLDRQLALDFGSSSQDSSSSFSSTRISVIGNSFGGIGVNDCIASGYQVVDRLSSPPSRQATSSPTRNDVVNNTSGHHQVLLDLP